MVVKKGHNHDADVSNEESELTVLSITSTA